MMVDSAPWSLEVRVLLCRKCGGQLLMPDEGGRAECTHCRAEREVGRRPAGQIAFEDPLDPTLEPEDREPARLELLRKQADAWSPERDPYAYAAPPHGLEHLGLLAPLDPLLPPLCLQALTVALGRLEESSTDLADQRAVFYTTLKWHYMWNARGESERGRAAVQTALELLSDPGHQQVLTCAMADLARRAGDLESAAAWLTLCEPRPALLAADSAFRASRGRIHLLREEWQEVLDLVGDRSGSVPMQPSTLVMFAGLRISALEATGKSDRAEEELLVLLRAVEEEAVKGIFWRNEDWWQCRQVWLRIEAQQDLPSQVSAALEEEEWATPGIGDEDDQPLRAFKWGMAAWCALMLAIAALTQGAPLFLGILALVVTAVLALVGAVIYLRYRLGKRLSAVERRKRLRRRG